MRKVNKNKTSEREQIHTGKNVEHPGKRVRTRTQSVQGLLSIKKKILKKSLPVYGVIIFSSLHVSACHSMANRMPLARFIAYPAIHCAALPQMDSIYQSTPGLIVADCELLSG